MSPAPTPHRSEILRSLSPGSDTRIRAQSAPAATASSAGRQAVNPLAPLGVGPTALDGRRRLRSRQGRFRLRRECGTRPRHVHTTDTPAAHRRSNGVGETTGNCAAQRSDHHGRAAHTGRRCIAPRRSPTRARVEAVPDVDGNDPGTSLAPQEPAPAAMRVAIPQGWADPIALACRRCSQPSLIRKRSVVRVPIAHSKARSRGPFACREPDRRGVNDR